MADGHSDRLKSFLSNADVPKLLAKDIQVILQENADLRRELVGLPARWAKLIAYFEANEIDIVLYLHSRLGYIHWTCFLWGRRESAWAEGATADIAMHSAFLKLKRPADREGA